MAKFRIRYLVTRPLKNGSARHYWQPDAHLRAAGWKMERLSDDLSEAMKQAEDKNTLVDQWRAGMIAAPANTAPGGVSALVESYKKSRRYLALAVRTRKDYDYYLDRICEWAEGTRAADISAKMVQDLYEVTREKSPRKAAYIVQVLRLLFSHAEREDIIPKNSNPATKPGIDYKASKGRLWTPDDVTHFIATADKMGYQAIGTALQINEWIGQRRGDLISLTMNAYRGGVFYIRQSKTGAEVALPVDMVPQLKQRIEAQVAANRKKSGKDRDNAIVGTSLIQQKNRMPYTGDGFMTAFEKVLIHAIGERPSMKGLVFKDMRHTAVTRLAEAGATVQQIASITGHTFKSAQEIIDRYNIRTTTMAREAFQRRLDFEATKKGENQ